MVMPLFARAQSSPLPVPVPSKSPTTHPNVDGIPTALAHSSRCRADLYRNNRGGLGSTGIEMWSPFTCYASSTHPLLAGGGRGYPAILECGPPVAIHIQLFAPNCQLSHSPIFSSTQLCYSPKAEPLKTLTMLQRSNLNELKPTWK